MVQRMFCTSHNITFWVEITYPLVRRVGFEPTMFPHWVGVLQTPAFNHSAHLRKIYHTPYQEILSCDRQRMVRDTAFLLMLVQKQNLQRLC